MRRHATKTGKIGKGLALATLLAAAAVGPRAAQAQILEGLAAGALVGGIMGAALYVWKPPADEPPGMVLEDGALADDAHRIASTQEPLPLPDDAVHPQSGE